MANNFAKTKISRAIDLIQAVESAETALQEAKAKRDAWFAAHAELLLDVAQEAANVEWIDQPESLRDALTRFTDKQI